MKKLLTLTLLLSLLLCGCGKGEAPAPTEAPTASVTEAPATAAPEDNIPAGQEAVTTPPTEAPAYIRALARMASLDENGQERWYRTYEYDAQGRLLLEREVSSAGGESYRAEYAYQDGRRIITYTYADGTVEELTETLDDQGRVIHSYYSIYAGDPIPASQYAYDAYGNQESCVLWLDGQDISVQMFQYTYTPSGRIDTAQETMDGAFASRVVYRYDDRDRVAETQYYDASGLLHSTVHTWEGNTETVTTLDPEENVTIISIHTYDSDDGTGNLLREETQQDGVVISCAEYTYEDFEISGN